MRYLYCKKEPEKQDYDYFTQGKVYSITNEESSFSNGPGEWVVVEDNRGENSTHNLNLADNFTKKYFIILNDCVVIK